MGAGDDFEILYNINLIYNSEVEVAFIHWKRVSGNSKYQWPEILHIS